MYQLLSISNRGKNTENTSTYDESGPSGGTLTSVDCVVRCFHLNFGKCSLHPPHVRGCVALGGNEIACVDGYL